ncbi:metallophosphoesterase [Spirosoma taeanense]|uniref:Metallophosphoesterase n=1 Tax=Spirosoma taeanense TaxID=2735870 RepID=A0A6M5Y755_9BACT|nr:metallophosphoesterase [Spirosoma taeanense]QJW89246.1 metallophosphoesterase [Spirosoma taeanense]
MNRRTLLKTAGLLPIAAAPGLITSPALARKLLTRFAYIGDTHITAQLKPMEAIARCLHHAQDQADKPTFMLHGGDVIMDALAQDRDKVTKQWTAWHEVVKADNSLPVEYCIGNHDVWGYENAKNDPLYGKKWAVDQMQISGRYRSFDRNGWHFIMLDSVQPTPEGKWYTGHIDPEQMAWLKQDLAVTDSKTPVLVLSHIPIVSATVFYDKANVKNGNWQIPGSWNHTDAVDLIGLFYQYPNVRACLSGHMHLLDRVEYNGVTYFCNGAVSGNWWNGDTYHETKAGYALFDLYDDGSIERTYLPYA